MAAVRLPNVIDMSAESLSIALSLATLIVIAATAVAAIVQLRHLRASNQLNALLEILDQWNKPELQAAYTLFAQTMTAKVADPQYVAMLRRPGSKDRGTSPELLVFDLWEQVGAYVKHGLIDEDTLLDIINSQVVNAWKLAAPAIDIMRERGGPSTYENFEFLTVRAKMWSRRNPNGTYPRGLPRIADLDF